VAFRDRLAELGAALLEPEYLGSGKRHHVRCAAGHDCWPRPTSVQRGQGICKKCGTAPFAAARFLAGGARFRLCLEQLGAVLLEPEYLGSKQPHLVRCPNGHECRATPNAVLMGHGLCRFCKGIAWDVFYIVTHAREPRVKFGITSVDPRPRLRVHRKGGYTTVVTLVTGLSGTLAHDAENAICAALADAGERPVHGREYFDISCLPLILDVASGWLAGQGAVIVGLHEDQADKEEAA
jgi:hypothetical protein